MRNVPSLPWWGWALIAFFVLNVVLRRDVGIFGLVIVGMIAAGIFGQGRRVGGGRAGGTQPTGQPLPPVQPTDESTPGWAGGSGTGTPPSTSPSDSPAPGSSPWVRGSSQHPSTGTTPGSGTSTPGTGAGSGPGTGSGMPRIEVPEYPHGAAQPTAYPPSGTSPSTDPVVSLGQLHLSRCSRDLHTAASTGSSADVTRVLAEVGDQADRLLAQLSGTGSMPGSGRREFETGLRRLQRDVQAARGEDPPGPKVSHVVQRAGQMGQTGRYE